MRTNSALRRRIALVVSEVILKTTGRSVDPAPDAPLFDGGPLDPSEATHLALALQDEFDVALAPHQVNARALATIAKIESILRG